MKILHMQSWLFGKGLEALDPDAVTLHTSQGYETPHSKFLMRLSVIASDVLGQPHASQQTSCTAVTSGIQDRIIC